MKYIPLKDDLELHRKGWRTNPRATAEQKKRWPQNRKIPLAALGNPGKNPLILTDGEPVGSVSEAAARKYHADNEEHIHPPDRDLIRFGVFVHLEALHILHLVLKGQWERYFPQKIKWKHNTDGKSFYDVLKYSHKEAIDFSSSGFTVGLNNRAGKKELYRLFEEHGKLASRAGYDEESFGVLIDQMILSHCHLFGNCSPEIEDFIEKEKAERDILVAASSELSEAFWIKKCCWIELDKEVASLLMELEKERLKNANVNQKWMKTFGHVYMPMMEAQSRYYQVNRCIRLKEADPDLGLDEIEEIEREKEREESAKLKALQNELFVAQLIDLHGQNATPIGGQQLADYEKECKKVLREVYRYAHPDGVNHYEFTDNQVRTLRDYFEKAIEIRSWEIGGTIRQLNALYEVLSQIKSLWERMGLDLREDSVIKGASLEERIHWLEEKIQQLEKKRDYIWADRHALAGDKDIQEKRVCLSSEEQISQTLKQMGEKKKWYEDQIELLEENFRAMFEQEEARK